MADEFDVSAAFRLSNGIELPAFDTREAKAFELPNGLKAVVISDPHTEVAACSVEVSVGHFSDPAELPGLAHYLEHLLFMGTVLHPDENSFSAFLNEKGGYSNGACAKAGAPPAGPASHCTHPPLTTRTCAAYTATEATNFHLECTADALHEALKRFAGFFTCPLLSWGGAARELDAVDSEHNKNLQSECVLPPAAQPARAPAP